MRAFLDTDRLAHDEDLDHLGCYQNSTQYDHWNLLQSSYLIHLSKDLLLLVVEW